MAMDRTELTELCAQLSDLSVSGSGNTVNINITVNSSPRPSSSATTKQAPKATRESNPSASGVPPKRYYVICSSPKAPELKGIWEAHWAEFAPLLPGGQLFGSGCKPCSGHNSWRDAVDKWEKRLPGEELVYHLL